MSDVVSGLPTAYLLRTVAYFPFQTDRDVEVIRVDLENTVKSLRDKLQKLVDSANDDSGFPIVREDSVGPRLIGYIGANELEHALSSYRYSLSLRKVSITDILCRYRR